MFNSNIVFLTNLLNPSNQNPNPNEQVMIGVNYDLSYEGNEWGFFQGAVMDYSGNMIGFGSISNENELLPVIVKFNSTGVFQWAKYLEAPVENPNGTNCYGELAGIDLDNNIYFFAYSDYSYSIEGFSSVRLLKVSPSGSLIFQKDICPDDGVYNIGSMRIISDGIIWSVNTSVVKFDFNGNIVWTKTFNHTRGRNPIEVDSLGNIYTQVLSSTNTSVIIKLSSIGDIIWAKEHSIDYSIGEFDLRSRDNSSFAITDDGSIYSVCIGDAGYIKYDSNGNIANSYIIDVNGLDPYISCIRAKGNYVYIYGESKGGSFIIKVNSLNENIVYCKFISEPTGSYIGTYWYTTADGSLNITNNYLTVGGYDTNGWGVIFKLPLNIPDGYYQDNEFKLYDCEYNRIELNSSYNNNIGDFVLTTNETIFHSLDMSWSWNSYTNTTTTGILQLATIDTDPFIMTVSMLQDNSVFNYPIRDYHNRTIFCYVDWGDGTPEQLFTSLTNSNWNHTYENSGVYDISIKGYAFAPDFNAVSSSASNLIDIKQWGNLINATDWSNAFKNCINLGNITATDIFGSEVSTFFYMFADCINFNGNLSNWDMSNATLTYAMFRGCTNFNSDLSNWNVSNVNTMSHMFYNCTNFNSDLSNWNVSNVATMSTMFAGCTNFNSDLSNWNVSNVTDMGHMFYNCTNFNSNISNWNVSNVNYTYAMFYNCTNFNQLLSNWNVSNVTNMSHMFHKCTNFNGNLSNWNVGNLKYSEYMFEQCTLFNSDLSNWNVSNLEVATSMFAQCSNFESDLSNWNTSKLTTSIYMFLGCSKFNSNISNWNTSSLINMSGMFWNATLFNQPIGNWNISNVTDISTLFINATSFNQPLANWNVSKVTNMHNLFNGAISFNQPIGNWNLAAISSDPNNMRYVFNSATSFNQNISCWNVSHIASEPEFFSNNCPLITEYKPKWGQTPNTGC